MAALPRSSAKTAIATILALAGAGGLAWLGASVAADVIESRTDDAVTASLHEGGFDWADVETSGLQVRLSGTAPSEVARFRAIAQVGQMVDPGRIDDRIEVASSKAIATPDFSIELLRNDEGISLIGLVPAQTDREALVAELSKLTSGKPVTDLLETADYAVPDGWDSAFRYGLTTLRDLRRAKVSIQAGHVAITAITDSAEARNRLEAELRRRKPSDVSLASEINAPRPVITPFTLRFLIDENGPHFDACSADTEEARTRILAAAAAAGVTGGVTGSADCHLGLGVPSPKWAEAVLPAIAAVRALGAGSVTFSDADVALSAPATVTQEAFDEAVAKLQTALPVPFSLQAELEQAEERPQGPAEFTARMTAQGVTLRGRITDERMREAVESFARARFGNIDSALRTDDSVPAGWTVRVIAGLEAMAELKDGTVKVTPDTVSLTGITGSRTGSDTAARALSRRLGEGARYQLGLHYDARLDPLSGLPSGTECVDRMNTVMQESEIGFATNSVAIAGDIAPVMQRMAEAMQDCEAFRIEVGGHTDSRGRAEVNQRLSDGRAASVLKAMASAGLPVTHLTSKGYGDSQPVESNDTEEGREANRRIEFRLVSDTPVETTAPAAAPMVSGVTQAAPETAPDAAPETTPAQAPTDVGQPAPAATPDAATPEPLATEAAAETTPEITTAATELVSRLLATDLADEHETPAHLAHPRSPAEAADAGAAAAAALSLGIPLDFAAPDGDTEPSQAEIDAIPVNEADETTPRPAPRPQAGTNP